MYEMVRSSREIMMRADTNNTNVRKREEGRKDGPKEGLNRERESVSSHYVHIAEETTRVTL